MQPYMFIKDDMEGKSMTEISFVHPQLVRVARTKMTLGATWKANQTHLYDLDFVSSGDNLDQFSSKLYM